MAKKTAIEQEDSPFGHFTADPVKVPAKLIAKKDFVIHQNEVHIEIKAGDDVSEVPERFLENLKTESVI